MMVTVIAKKGATKLLPGRQSLPHRSPQSKIILVTMAYNHVRRWLPKREQQSEYRTEFNVDILHVDHDKIDHYMHVYSCIQRYEIQMILLHVDPYKLPLMATKC